MKNVLLTTTALVVFAGGAFAASHGGNATSISFSGDAEVKYNDPNGDIADAEAAKALADALEANPTLTAAEQQAILDDTGDSFSYSADLTVTGTAALNNGVTATLTYGIKLDDSTGNVTGDQYPVLILESAYGKLSAGDADEVGPASDHYSKTDGGGGFSDGQYEDDDFAIRADVSYSSIDISVSESDVLTDGDSDLRVGASGSFGNFTVGLGYADEAEEVGLNVGTTFGAFSVDASVFDGAGTLSDDDDDGINEDGTIFGVQVGYTVNDSLSVGAYVSNFVKYGVSADYASGALTVGVAYSGGDIDDEASIDVTYDIGSGLVAYAGYAYVDADDSNDDGGYVGLVYDLGAGAEAWISYSEFDESGDPKFDDGVTVGVSVKF